MQVKGKKQEQNIAKTALSHGEGKNKIKNKPRVCKDYYVI